MVLVVILGRRLNDDGSMTKDLYKRLDLGIETFKKVKPDYLCLCGGVANKKAGLSEASQMFEYSINHGINEEVIICEDESETTLENAKNLKDIIGDDRIDKIYLVSCKKHFTRIIYPKAHILFMKYFKDTEIIKVYY